VKKYVFAGCLLESIAKFRFQVIHQNMWEKGHTMDEKLQLLKEYMPKAALKALTPEAADAVPKTNIFGELVIISILPYRVGRESRVVRVNGRLEQVEREKKAGSRPNNDLYLVDRGHRLNISREHFLIERREEAYFLVDRGSACGVKVGEEGIGGGDVGGEKEIFDGDVISIGAKGTPYVFQFLAFDDYAVVRREG